VFQFVDFV